MSAVVVRASRARIRVWRGAGRTGAALAAVVAMFAAVVAPAATTRARTVADRMVHVIVTGVPGMATDATRIVETAGGRVLHALPIVHGFDAVIPAGAVGRLASAEGVRGVTPDVGVHLSSTPPDPTTWPGATPYDPKRYAGSMYNVAREINADNMWAAGFSGKGVGVALIDSGVAPVPDIAANLVNGPDLSLDATGGSLDGVDAFGHGTHMAGIIAGNDQYGKNLTGAQYVSSSSSYFYGMAPDAHILNMKVGDESGVADVSQVIAAVDWVVQHRNDNSMNTKVINLSYGTVSGLAYSLDPLAYAT
ncbi:MAG TPA: S8 family serine peptidase, partial [Acidimicrobiia bacterium]|nr:S8 family serine peptidase [Acidimicrobiia bacterium]